MPRKSTVGLGRKPNTGLPWEPCVVLGRRQPSAQPTGASGTGLGWRWLGTCVVALFAALAATTDAAWAQDRAQDVRTEVVALLAAVENGGCSFMRNGSWHSAAEARKLLEYKFTVAMRDPASMTSAEHFIAKMGSHSSLSGKPYLVRCGDTQAVESGPWLMGKLATIRAARPARPAPAAAGASAASR